MLNAKSTILAALLALLPLAAAAQTTFYRCVGKDGKKYYGSAVPTQCLGQPVEQMNKQGMVVKRFDAAASAAEREKKAAEEEERKKREAISKEEGRRNRALLATYTSEKDIDQARGRALKENEATVKEIEGRIASLKKRQVELRREKGSPEKFERDMKSTEFDIKTQQELLATKEKEVEQINARYDEDKKRYVELTRGGTK